MKGPTQSPWIRRVVLVQVTLGLDFNASTTGAFIWLSQNWSTFGRATIALGSTADATETGSCESLEEELHYNEQEPVEEDFSNEDLSLQKLYNRHLLSLD